MSGRPQIGSMRRMMLGLPRDESETTYDPIGDIRQNALGRWKCGDPREDRFQDRFLRAERDVKLLLTEIRRLHAENAKLQPALLGMEGA